MLRQLTQTTLVGGRLILIDRAETVRRYRACMERLGIEPTKLNSFHIDGIGWSPEIADEFDSRDYLSHGVANPVGIIVTTNQQNRPIYVPAHSFDRLMMRDYFDANRAAIADLTTETGIALDIDQRMTWYRTLDSVCAVRFVRIISDAGELAEQGEVQKGLVGTFMQEDTDAWLDDELRRSIIRSFKGHGKLFDRKLSIGEFVFSKFDDLYTRALGGVYVFRHKGIVKLVIVEDKEQRKNASKQLAPFVACVSDKDIVSRIRNAEIADIDIEWYRQHPKVLEDRLKTLALFILSENDPELPVDVLKPAQITGHLRKCGAKSVESYISFEECAAAISAGQKIVDLLPEVEAMLLHPVLTSSKYEENLAWQLICQVQPRPADVLRLYAVNKNQFTERYATWSKPMRAWARNQIQERYRSELTYAERGVQK